MQGGHLMIKQYSITLTKNTVEKFSSHWGYQLYGILMELVDTQFAESLHSQGITPISQSITSVYTQNKGIWSITIFGEQAIENFSKVIDPIEKFYMKNHDTEFYVQKKDIEFFKDEDDFMKSIKSDDAINKYKIKFITPTTIKSGGDYMLFPSIEQIIRSLIIKWNNYSEKYVIEDEDAIKFLIDGLKIVSYNLKSQYYHMKSTKIPAYIGEITIMSKLPQPMKELLLLVLRFAKYSGIGVKTTLGMGKIEVEI